jgi:hypothetical protein
MRSSVTGAAAAAPGLARRALRRSQRPTATPTQSNPAPKFDDDAGTRTVTLARIGDHTP